MTRFAILTIATFMITPLALSSQAPAGGELSEGTAVFLSTAATVVPFASQGLAPLAGLVLGPSAGHFYAGNARRAFLGILLRSATVVVTGALIVNDNSLDDSRAYSIAAAGALTLLVEVVADIVWTRDSVREANGRRQLPGAGPPPARQATDSPKPVPRCAGVCP